MCKFTTTLQDIRGRGRRKRRGPRETARGEIASKVARESPLGNEDQVAAYLALRKYSGAGVPGEKFG